MTLLQGFSQFDRLRFLRWVCLRRNFTLEELASSLKYIPKQKLDEAIRELMRENKLDHDPPSAYGHGYFVTVRGLVLLEEEAVSIIREVERDGNTSSCCKIPTKPS